MSSNNSNGNNTWTWSPDHKKYYRTETSATGHPVYIWQDGGTEGTAVYAPQQQTAGSFSQAQSTAQVSYQQPSTQGFQPQTIDYGYSLQANGAPNGQQAVSEATATVPPRPRVDSIAAEEAEMASSAPDDVRDQIAFQGTPSRGWYEILDPRYRVRTNAEEYEFFKQGRVFAMLWSEPAGESVSRRTATENSRYTAHPNSSIVQGPFGQKIYCSIRRFVIVRVNRRSHFVEACPITTYGNRGVLKPGCNPSEHTIVYLKGTNPSYMPGEYHMGMTKEPIAIESAEADESMSPLSRLRLGKTHTIECNVKVRDIGKVAPEHKTTLLRYHQDTRDVGWEPDDYGDAPSAVWPAHQNPQSNYGHHGQQGY